MTIITRRSALIGSITTLFAAPAIVRASSLMPVSARLTAATFDTSTASLSELAALMKMIVDSITIHNDKKHGIVVDGTTIDPGRDAASQWDGLRWKRSPTTS